jgi:hypothetical protein
MTVSGTISTTSINVADLVTTAYRRCRVRPEQITADMLESAKIALHVALSAMPHKGFQLWTHDEESLALVAGDGEYTLSTGTIAVTHANYLLNNVETPLSAMSADQYIAIPDKATQGRPNSFWIDFQRDTPVMRIWPVPNAAAAAGSITYWRKRYIMDVGSFTATLDIPQGWHDAIISDLAARLAIETPEVDVNLAGQLRMIAENALLLAQRHNTNSAPLRITPRIRYGR